MMAVRGIRGAITAEANTREAVLAATHELLVSLVAANGVEPDDVASVIFTTTRDLNAEYPALAARAIGWRDVPLMCAHEMDVPGGVPRCIRILIHWNTERAAGDVVHVYLGGAKGLRPDRAMTAQIEEMIEAYKRRTA